MGTGQNSQYIGENKESLTIQKDYEGVSPQCYWSEAAQANVLAYKRFTDAGDSVWIDANTRLELTGVLSCKREVIETKCYTADAPLDPVPLADAKGRFAIDNSGTLANGTYDADALSTTSNSYEFLVTLEDGTSFTFIQPALGSATDFDGQLSSWSQGIVNGYTNLGWSIYSQGVYWADADGTINPPPTLYPHPESNELLAVYLSNSIDRRFVQFEVDLRAPMIASMQVVNSSDASKIGATATIAGMFDLDNPSVPVTFVEPTKEEKRYNVVTYSNGDVEWYNIDGSIVTGAVVDAKPCDSCCQDKDCVTVRNSQELVDGEPFELPSGIDSYELFGFGDAAIHVDDVELVEAVSTAEDFKNPTSSVIKVMVTGGAGLVRWHITSCADAGDTISFDPPVPANIVSDTMLVEE